MKVNESYSVAPVHWDRLPANHQRFSLFFQKSPTVQNLWLQGHENSKPMENISIPRGFLGADSSILILWLIPYQIRSPWVSHGSCSLFTDGHFLRHKVTVFHVQHSTSRKYNEADGSAPTVVQPHLWIYSEAFKSTSCVDFTGRHWFYCSVNGDIKFFAQLQTKQSRRKQPAAEDKNTGMSLCQECRDHGP